MNTNPAVDEYIEKAAPFAKPILTEIRAIVHQACPQVEEVIKWQFPNFVYKGNICSMAAFKKHCTFTFWKGKILKDPDNILSIVGKTSMGQIGALHSISDLPNHSIMKKYLKEAMKLNEENIAIPKKKGKTAALRAIPDVMTEALKHHSVASKVFESFSVSNKNDYIEWITDAKREGTRTKRIHTMLEWLAEGKVRNWKYIK